MTVKCYRCGKRVKSNNDESHLVSGEDMLEIVEDDGFLALKLENQEIDVDWVNGNDLTHKSEYRNARVSKDDVEEISERFSNGENFVDLAEEYRCRLDIKTIKHRRNDGNIISIRSGMKTEVQKTAIVCSSHVKNSDSIIW
jgi:hypothetical protein